MGNCIPVAAQRRAQLRSTFILSTGRTGTMLIGWFFDRYAANAQALHEPFPNLRDVALQFAYGHVTQARTVRRLRRARHHWVRCQGNRLVYLESNNRIWSLVPALRIVFPGCRIVHLIRDGRSFVPSAMVHRGGWFGPDDRVPRLEATGLPSDPYGGRWCTMSQVEKCAWLWQKQNRRIAASLEGLDDVYTMRFEDLFSPEKRSGHLGRLIEIVGADVGLSDDELNRVAATRRNASGQAAGHRYIWTTADWDRFIAIAGDLMRLFGYDTSRP